MRRLIPSPALIVASLALALSLGGVSYAATKIGTRDIAKDAIVSSKIKDGTIQPADLGPAVASSIQSMQVRAWGNVSVEAELIAERTKGFTSVTRPKRGIYCLTFADTALDPATVAPVVTVDWDNSSGANLAAYVSKSAHQCPEGSDLGVRTYSWTAGAASKLANTVAFTIVVP